MTADVYAYDEKGEDLEISELDIETDMRTYENSYSEEIRITIRFIRSVTFNEGDTFILSNEYRQEIVFK